MDKTVIRKTRQLEFRNSQRSRRHRRRRQRNVHFQPYLFGHNVSEAIDRVREEIQMAVEKMENVENLKSTWNRSCYNKGQP